MNKNGIVLWEGPSVLNGEPIVAIATGFQRSTKNDKIGKETIQVWYLSPNVASREAKTKQSAATAYTDHQLEAPVTSSHSRHR